MKYIFTKHAKERLKERFELDIGYERILKSIETCLDNKKTANVVDKVGGALIIQMSLFQKNIELALFVKNYLTATVVTAIKQSKEIGTENLVKKLNREIALLESEIDNKNQEIEQTKKYKKNSDYYLLKLLNLKNEYDKINYLIDKLKIIKHAYKKYKKDFFKLTNFLSRASFIHRLKYLFNKNYFNDFLEKYDIVILD